MRDSINDSNRWWSLRIYQIQKKEKKKKRRRKRRIYILKIFIAIFNKCDVEHILFFILFNVYYCLSNACFTFAIISSFDNVKAFDDASFDDVKAFDDALFLMTNKIIVTFFFKFSNLLI